MGENAKTDRVLRDDELDLVSGGKIIIQDGWPTSRGVACDGIGAFNVNNIDLWVGW